MSNYHEPPENFTDICDCCKQEKTMFESCNSDYCDTCCKILSRGTKIFSADDRYHKVPMLFGGRLIEYRCGPVRKYKLCVDCSSKVVEDE